ncbi:MAG: heavy metal-associated domain-containing protein [Cyanobacteriota bacterium]|nr:heavy metal-associated domain-containing protein [Cyanobacteriota bacterium]
MRRTPHRLAVPLAALAISLIPTALLAASPVYRIKVAGMVCSFCAQGIEKRVLTVPGAEAVRVDLSQRLVEVTPRQGAVLDQAALRRAIRDAGYDVRSIEAPAAAPPAKPR